MCASRAQMVMQRKTQGLYRFGLNVPTSSSSVLVFLHWFELGATNGRERELGSQVSVLRGLVCVCVKDPPPVRGLSSPFYSPRERWSDTWGEGRKKEKRSRGRALPDPLSPASGPGGST